MKSKQNILRGGSSEQIVQVSEIKHGRDTTEERTREREKKREDHGRVGESEFKMPRDSTR